MFPDRYFPDRYFPSRYFSPGGLDGGPVPPDPVVITVILTSAPNPSTVGQSVTLTATVTVS